MANGGIIGTVNNPTSTTATGVWQQEEQYEAVRDGTWPQRALFTTKSARFNQPSSDYLNRTATSGNRQVATFSGWLKKGSNGVDTNRVFLEYNSGTNYFEIRWRDADNLRIYEELNGSTGFELITNRLFRDNSAWYHIVVAIDTTQGTAANRIKLYVNGVQETSFATETYPSQNYNVQMNVADKAVQIGAYSFSGSNYFNGYMSEIIWVDGTALAPTSFGVANSDGVWTPIIYTGSFGNNGFNLQFENAAALGTDSSPNGNTFTVNNLTSIDQSTDYPEVNFATMNPLDVSLPSTFALSEGNLDTLMNGINSNDYPRAYSNIQVASGKWYVECKITEEGDSGAIGISARSGTSYVNVGGTNYDWLGINAHDYRYYHDGTKMNNNSSSSYGTTWDGGDTIGIALDMDNLAVYFSLNGTFQASGDPTSGSSRTNAAFNLTAVASTPNGSYKFAFGTQGGTNVQGQWNFGSPPYSISSGNADGNGYGNFEYAVPSGYYALNTANLAEFG